MDAGKHMTLRIGTDCQLYISSVTLSGGTSFKMQPIYPPFDPQWFWIVELSKVLGILLAMVLTAKWVMRET